MRDLDPDDPQDEEAVFAWDPTPYPTEAPLYDPPRVDLPEVPFYYGFAPVAHPDGSKGVWRWVNSPAGFLDAERVIRPSAGPSAGAPNGQP